MSALLEVQGLETFYGASQALFGVSFTLEAGEVVTLIGRNGMGKTTTVNSLMGIVPPAKGVVQFEGQVISGQASHRIARLGLGLVPEGRQVFPNLTAEENLIATAGNHTKRPKPWSLADIFALFPALESRRTSMANLLSGGEQQMLAIGRALMTNPRLLILDEATEGLAPMVRAEIWEVLTKLKEAGQTILIIDKNVHDLARIADRHLIIEKGKTVWEGSSEQLLENPDLLGRFLGV